MNSEYREQKSDLERAKRLLAEGGYTCALVCGERELVSRERGIRPLVKWIEKGTKPRGYSAADKIVGKAAALLYAYMGIGALFAAVLSEEGAAVLQKFGIASEYETLVPVVINRKGDGVCPMEQTVQGTDVPAKALELLKNKIAEFSQRE